MANSRLITHVNDTVTFSVLSRYDPGQTVVCKYTVNPQYEVQSRDYVGLYLAEDFDPSRSVANYLTWQWADIHCTSGHCAINFPARHLPEASPQFLLFAYVSRSMGVIGSSDHFQVIYFCGDPISLISCTTDNSSFVVLEKNPDHFSTPAKFSVHNSLQNSYKSENGSLCQNDHGQAENNFPTEKPVDREDILAGNATDHIQTSTLMEVTEDENNDTEGTVDLTSTAAGSKTLSENRTPAELKTTDCNLETQKIEPVDLSPLHDPDQHGGINSKDEICRLQLQLKRETEKSLEMMMVLERTTREKESLLAHISSLEGNLGKQADENAMLQRSPEKQLLALEEQIAKLMQENQHLFNKVETVQQQVKAREQDLSYAKARLYAANTKIRELEHALITERLTYEKELKRQAIDPVMLNNKETANEDLGHTLESALQKESEESDLASFIPTQERSASALVRLGIEDEVTATPEIQELELLKPDIRCPICNKSASEFADQAAFHVHVDKHFSD